MLSGVHPGRHMIIRSAPVAREGSPYNTVCCMDWSSGVHPGRHIVIRCALWEAHDHQERTCCEGGQSIQHCVLFLQISAGYGHHPVQEPWRVSVCSCCGPAHTGPWRCYPTRTLLHLHQWNSTTSHSGTEIELTFITSMRTYRNSHLTRSSLLTSISDFTNTI